MNIQVKPGRWLERGGGLATVQKEEPDRPHYKFFGINSLGWPSWWREDGFWLLERLQSQYDLVAYLGPEEPVGGES